MARDAGQKRFNHVCLCVCVCVCASVCVCMCDIINGFPITSSSITALYWITGVCEKFYYLSSDDKFGKQSVNMEQDSEIICFFNNKQY